MIFGMTYGVWGLIAFISAIALPVLTMAVLSGRHTAQRNAESSRNHKQRLEENFPSVEITQLPSVATSATRQDKLAA